MGTEHEPSPIEGRGTTHDTNLAPYVGPWYVDIQWPGYHPNQSLPSAGIGQLPGAWLPKLNENCVLSLRNSVQTDDISQVPDHMTSGNRVQWLCAHSGWTLSPVWNVSVFHGGENSAQSTIKGHQGLWWSICSVPRGNDEERLTVHEGPFSAKETHPRRTEMPDTRQVAPDIPKDLSRSAVLWTNSAPRVSKQWEHFKVPGAYDIFKCYGHIISF